MIKIVSCNKGWKVVPFCTYEMLDWMFENNIQFEIHPTTSSIYSEIIILKEEDVIFFQLRWCQ